MGFLHNKKGSLIVLNDTSSNLEKTSFVDEQNIVFSNSKKVKIVFNRPEYRMDVAEE